MKLSIRTKLFLTLTGLILFFVGFSFLLNSRYLSDFYIWQKKHTLVETKSRIEEIYKGNPQSLSIELENLEINRGISVTFLTSDYKLIYTSFFRGGPEHHDREPKFPLINLLDLNRAHLAAGDYQMKVVEDPGGPEIKRKFILLVSRLNNGDILILNTPIARIDESAQIANRFFMFTGLITIIFGGIFLYFFSRRFTNPILELSNIAKKMSKLDFSEKYKIDSQDEIGQLGMSINSLSEQLGKAIIGLTEANTKLKSDIERERRLEKMRKEFVSGVSHELKTPIAIIQGYAEGLKLNVNEDEENRNFYCDVITDETQKMNRLVLSLLDLSQMESGNMKIEKELFDFSCLVSGVAEKFKHLLSEKGVVLQLNKTDNVQVLADSSRIEQVLVNLLSNAMNHVDENKKIHISLTSEDGQVLCSIYNSGQNIPDEAIEKLWHSFYKIDPARTRAYGGTGLGLSIVRAILDLHNTSYGVENKVDGVLFWFKLDIAN